MIELKGTILIPMEAHPKALPALDEHITLTRNEPANIVFEVTQDPENAELFHVFEQFTDQAGFEAHQKLGKSREWGQISQDFFRNFEVKEI